MVSEEGFEENFDHDLTPMILCLHTIHLQVITLDSDSTPVLQIKAHRQKAGKTETSHYKVTISRLRARLNIAISYNTHKGEMTVEGYPDVSGALLLIWHFKFLLNEM